MDKLDAADILLLWSLLFFLFSCLFNFLFG